VVWQPVCWTDKALAAMRQKKFGIAALARHGSRISGGWGWWLDCKVAARQTGGGGTLPSEHFFWRCCQYCIYRGQKVRGTLGEGSPHQCDAALARFPMGISDSLGSWVYTSALPETSHRSLVSPSISRMPPFASFSSPAC